MWLTYAPIPDYTAAFFGVKLEQVDWFSISYFVVSLLIGFVGIFILDKWGLRISVSTLITDNSVGSLHFQARRFLLFFLLLCFSFILVLDSI